MKEQNKIFQGKYSAKCVKLPSETLSEEIQPPLQLKQRTERLVDEKTVTDKDFFLCFFGLAGC